MLGSIARHNGYEVICFVLSGEKIEWTEKRINTQTSQWSIFGWKSLAKNMYDETVWNRMPGGVDETWFKNIFSSDEHLKVRRIIDFQWVGFGWPQCQRIWLWVTERDVNYENVTKHWWPGSGTSEMLHLGDRRSSEKINWYYFEIY